MPKGHVTVLGSFNKNSRDEIIDRLCVYILKIYFVRLLKTGRNRKEVGKGINKEFRASKGYRRRGFSATEKT